MSRTSSHASIDRQTAPGKGLSAIAVALLLLLLGACVGPKGEEKPARAPGAVEAAAPEISLVDESGLSVTVNGAAKALRATVPVSTVRSLVILIVTFPVTPELLSASKMPPGFVSDG